MLALQEVDRSQSRSQHADLAEVAAEAMGAEDYRFVPTLAGTPGAMWAMSPTHRPAGEYGIALLSALSGHSAGRTSRCRRCARRSR